MSRRYIFPFLYKEDREVYAFFAFFSTKPSKFPSPCFFLLTSLFSFSTSSLLFLTELPDSPCLSSNIFAADPFNTSSESPCNPKA